MRHVSWVPEKKHVWQTKNYALWGVKEGFKISGGFFPIVFLFRFLLGVLPTKNFSTLQSPPNFPWHNITKLWCYELGLKMGEEFLLKLKFDLELVLPILLFPILVPILLLPIILILLFVFLLLCVYPVETLDVILLSLLILLTFFALIGSSAGQPLYSMMLLGSRETRREPVSCCKNNREKKKLAWREYLLLEVRKKDLRRDEEDEGILSMRTSSLNTSSWTVVSFDLPLTLTIARGYCSKWSLIACTTEDTILLFPENCMAIERERRWDDSSQLA